MRRTTPLTIACTPDSDEASHYDALENGLVSLPGYRLRFRREPITVLNREAVAGINEVTAISSVVYPSIADRYAILGVGASVGRGSGPVLVSREPRTLSTLAGRRVGVPGVPTTGWFLVRALCRDAVPVAVPFDEIAGAVAAGELDAGVMIHEERLDYPQMGLRTVIDLGAEWRWRNALPLPVGLTVVRRDLGGAGMRAVCHAISTSLHHAIMAPESAIDRLNRFGRGADGSTDPSFQTLTNDSQRMPSDVRAALGVLFSQMAALGAGPNVPRIDIIEPAPATAVMA